MTASNDPPVATVVHTAVAEVGIASLLDLRSCMSFVKALFDDPLVVQASKTPGGSSSTPPLPSSS
jgi:hypothetical protein